MRRLLVTVALGTAVIFAGWVWVYGPSGSSKCLEMYPGLPESSGFRVDGKLWPPGTVCVYELPNGRTVSRSSFA